MSLNVIKDQYHSLTLFLQHMILKYASTLELWIQMKVSFLKKWFLKFIYL